MKIKNPIPDIINDETYSLLKTNYLLDEVGIRDYIIKKKFNELKEKKYSSVDSFKKLSEIYDLKFDTVRKIVYGITYKHSEKVNNKIKDYYRMKGK